MFLKIIIKNCAFHSFFVTKEWEQSDVLNIFLFREQVKGEKMI